MRKQIEGKITQSMGIEADENISENGNSFMVS